MAAILDASARQLLNDFGKGKGMTGAGSIAALGALSAAQILISVCKLTSGKETYKEVHTDIQALQTVLEETYLPMIEGLWEADVAAVKNMVVLRIQRDKTEESEQKEALREEALKALVPAADIMIQLCNACLEMIPMALQVYDTGLKSARGDSAVALSTLLSAASSGLYTALINIKAAKNSPWAINMRQQVETDFGRLHEYQYIFNGRLTALYKDVMG